MQETTQVKLTVLVHTILGIIIGFFSPSYSTWIIVPVGVVFLLIVEFITEHFVRKGFKWLFVNGAILYLLVWLVSWVYFFNI